jgi:hypothetical protein
MSAPIHKIAFASALLGSGLSSSLGAGLAIDVLASPVFAADCLAAPDSSAPPNAHWYYRTDRALERKCWYLRGENQSPERAAVQVAREATSANPPQSTSAAAPYSLASFKEFLAERGGTELSDRDAEKLYAQFLEWRRRAKN